MSREANGRRRKKCNKDPESSEKRKEERKKKTKKKKQKTNKEKEKKMEKKEIYKGRSTHSPPPALENKNKKTFQLRKF